MATILARRLRPNIGRHADRGARGPGRDAILEPGASESNPVPNSRHRGAGERPDRLAERAGLELSSPDSSGTSNSGSNRIDRLVPLGEGPAWSTPVGGRL